jgi:FG-GAP repeat
MRRSTRPSWQRQALVAALLLLAASITQAQRVTSIDFNAVFPSSIGCIGPRCFSGVPAVDGDTAISTSTGTGVMVRSAPGLWNVQQVLWNPDGPPSWASPMGDPAALKGDTVLLTGTSRKYNDRPVMYAWQRTGTTWAHTQVLALPRPVEYDTVKVRSVAMNETFAAVCGVRHDFAYTRTLVQIDIFKRLPGGRFQRQAQLNPSITLGSQAETECRLGLEGNTLVVSDPMANAESGRVLVYQRGSSGWTLRHRLTAADSTEGAGFGNAVAISGNTIAIGAPRRPNLDKPLHLGAVYVYQRTANGWAQVQILVRPEFEEADPIDDFAEFGRDVSLSGDRLSTNWNNFDGILPIGYIFERRGVWAPVAGLNHEPGIYGGAPHLSGAIAIVTVSDGHSGSGSVVYELPPLWELPPRVEGP